MLRIVPFELYHSAVSFDASYWGRLQERLATGTVQQTGRPGNPIKPKCYCGEYKDTVDLRNATLVNVLREAVAIKCEELRQKALRAIRKRKREVPDRQNVGQIILRKVWIEFSRTEASKCGFFSFISKLICRAKVWAAGPVFAILHIAEGWVSQPYKLAICVAMARSPKPLATLKQT